MAVPFVVFSLPRSRSAWLSVLLSQGGAAVGHDIGITCATPAEFLRRVRRGGTCETGAAFAWRLIRREIPGVRFAVIRRDPEVVAESLRRFGLTGYLAEMERRDDILDEIAAQPGTLSLVYEDLAAFDACEALFEHCRATCLSEAWWIHIDRLNIQVDMPRRIEALRTNREEIEALKAAVRQELADA